VKEVLSANPKIPIFIEGVHDDMDLSTTLTRGDFEELCSDLIDRCTKPIGDALTKAGMTIKDLHSIEVIGGGVRVPIIQKKIKTYLEGMELGMHLNGDESPAQGAAFHAANISSQFKVRKVGMSDISPFGVNLEVQGLGDSSEGGSKWGFFGNSGSKKKNALAEEEQVEEMSGKFFKSKKVFDDNSLIGTSKIIPFTYDQNVACRVVYANPEDLPDKSVPVITAFNVTGIDKFAKELEQKGLGKPKVQLTFKLDEFGMVVLSKAEALFKEELTPEPEPEPEPEVEPEEESEKETDAKNSSEDTDAVKKDAESLDKEDEDIDISAEASKAKKEKSKKEKKVKKKKEKKPTSKIHKEVLKVEYDYSEIDVKPYTAEELQVSLNRLKKLRENDEKRQQLADIRNTLEGSVYDVKNKFEDEQDAIAEVSTEEQRTEILSLANEYDEWLYDDGSSASYEEVLERVQKIRILSGAIYLRMDEKQKRKGAVREAKKMLGDVLLTIEKWNSTHPQITSEEKEEATDLVNDISKWLDDNVEKQKSHPSHEKPVFLTSDLVSQMKPLKNKIKALSRKPKPKPPVEKTKKETNANETESTTTTETEDGNNANDNSNIEENVDGENMEPKTTTDYEAESKEDSESNEDDEEDVSEGL